MIHEWWALVSQLGLWGWIFAVIVFIFKAFPEQDRFNYASYGYGLISLMSFVVWVVGMTLA
jgi:hypothetical protein